MITNSMEFQLGTGDIRDHFRRKKKKKKKPNKQRLPLTTGKTNDHAGPLEGKNPANKHKEYVLYRIKLADCRVLNNKLLLSLRPENVHALF
jgi:hypothetical protein